MISSSSTGNKLESVPAKSDILLLLCVEFDRIEVVIKVLCNVRLAEGVLIHHFAVPTPVSVNVNKNFLFFFFRTFHRFLES